MIRDRHREAVSNCGTPAKKKNYKDNFTKLPIEARQNQLRSISKQFAAGPSDLLYFDVEGVKRVRASYAYLCDYELSKGRVRWTRFPWDVAMRDLCEIKAKRNGNSKTLMGSFYHTMDVTSFIRKRS